MTSLRKATEVVDECRFVDGQDPPYEEASSQVITADRLALIARLREMATASGAASDWIDVNVMRAADELEKEVREAE